MNKQKKTKENPYYPWKLLQVSDNGDSKGNGNIATTDSPVYNQLLNITLTAFVIQGLELDVL